MVKHLFGVAGRDAESGAFLGHFCRRKSDPDGGDSSVEKSDDEGGNLGHHVGHQGNDGAVVVAVDDEAHLNESPPAQSKNTP